jgi:glycosyltransferase involved in cell wall biosynthesis
MKARGSISIAYIMQTFPGLTLTFIYREVLALKRRGFDVTTFAIWKPDRDKLSPESRSLMDSTFYVFPISWLRFLWAHLYFLVTRPVKYVGTAVFVVTRRGETWHNRIRTAGHFAEAVYMAKEMEKLKIEHLHAHFTINAATIALIGARLLNISFSFTAHNIFFTDRIVLKEKIGESLFIAAISEYSRQFLIRMVPDQDVAGKIHIVRCGVSPEQFVPPEPKPVNDVPLILFVAQLAERKGAPFLVEACRLLAERGAPFKCVIVGDGAERPIVEQRIEQYGLQETVTLTGALFQEQLKPYLERADIFALPCITARDGDVDGIPVVLMESMAYEIATVSTTVSGIPELIEHEQSGLLVPEQDSLALADALQHLIADAQFRTKVGKNGRQKILLEFDVDQNAAKLATFFEEYLQRTGH